MVGTIKSIEGLEVYFSIGWNGYWSVVAMLKTYTADA
jgi:hypothetical protein